MTKESPKNYQYKYPHQFPWEKQINLIEKGDLLESNGIKYKVVDIYHRPIKGQIPILTIRKLEED